MSVFSMMVSWFPHVLLALIEIVWSFWMVWGWMLRENIIHGFSSRRLDYFLLIDFDFSFLVFFGNDFWFFGFRFLVKRAELFHSGLFGNSDWLGIDVDWVDTCIGGLKVSDKSFDFCKL